MGQRRARGGGGGQRRGDAGDDPAVHARGAAGFELIATATEDERIAALQANDGQALERKGDQHAVDFVLGVGVTGFAFGDADPARGRRREGDNGV